MKQTPFRELCGSRGRVRGAVSPRSIARLDHRDSSLRQLWLRPGHIELMEGTEETILFNTGQTWRYMLDNAAKIGAHLGTVSAIISHDHADHTGGLAAFCV